MEISIALNQKLGIKLRTINHHLLSMKQFIKLTV